MLEQYVSPGNKIVDLVASLQLPLANVRRGEEVMIVTDTSMDPLICQAVMAVVRSKGADPTLMMYTPRAHHTAEPTKAVAHAIKGCDICVFLTTTALAHSEFSERRGNTGILLMEEATVEILTSPGCQLDEGDLEQILARERWVREFWMEGGDVHVTTPAGTDLKAKLVKTDKRSAKVRGILVAEGERRGAGTWPFGECRVTPLEGTGEGRVVWDICGHAPPGRYAQPVVLTVEAGRVVKIEGGKEADGARRYLETYGDKNSYAAPAEISVGLNHKATIMGAVRNDKKALGTSHIAIGRSDIGGTLVSATHFDGLMARPTITVNGRTFIKDGVLQREFA
jgi:leucyl aminopeptidase (aminopeptidase T)